MHRGRRPEYRSRKRRGPSYGRVRRPAQQGQDFRGENSLFNPAFRGQQYFQQTGEERLSFAPSVPELTPSSSSSFQGGYADHQNETFQSQKNESFERHPPGHPQLSSNTTTAAIEASLMLLTELAKLAPGVSQGHLNGPHESLDSPLRGPGPSGDGVRTYGSMGYSDSVINCGQYRSDTRGDYCRQDPQPLFPSSQFSQGGISREENYHLQSENYSTDSVLDHGERRITGVPFDRSHSSLNSGSSDRTYTINCSSPHIGFQEKSPNYTSERGNSNLEGVYTPKYSGEIALTPRIVEKSESYLNFRNDCGIADEMKFGEHDSLSRKHFTIEEEREHQGAYHDLSANYNRDEDKYIHQSSSLNRYSGTSVDSGYVSSSSSHRKFQDQAMLRLRTQLDSKHLSRKRKHNVEIQSHKKRKSGLLYRSNSPRSKHSSGGSKVSDVQNRLGPQPLLDEGVEVPHDQVKSNMEDLRVQLTKKNLKDDRDKLRLDGGHSPVSPVQHPLSLPKFSPRKGFSSPSMSLSSLLPGEHIPLKSEVGIHPKHFSIKGENVGSVGLSPQLSQGKNAPNLSTSTSGTPNEKLIDSSSNTDDFHKSDLENTSTEDHMNLPNKPNLHLEHAQANTQSSNQVDTEQVSCSNSALASHLGKTDETKKKQAAPNLPENSTLQCGEISMHESSKSKVSTIFPFLGEGDIAKLPFSQPEMDKRESANSSMLDTFQCQEVADANNSIESDSESDGGLVIDINHVSDSPVRHKSNPIVSTAVHSATDEPDHSSVVVFESQTRPEYLKIAEEVLSSGLIHNLSLSHPSPLSSLYHSIDIVLGSTSRWELSLTTVQHAFRSFCISKQAQPWALPDLFKAELLSLAEGCKEDVGKWKSSAEVFSSILSSLLNRPGADTSKSSTKDIDSSKSSFASENAKKPLKSSVSSVDDEDQIDAVVHSTIESDDSVGTDPNECNMSVCSTISDGEIIAVGVSNHEGIKSNTLSPGELTPTPPSSPHSCSPALNFISANTVQVSQSHKIHHHPGNTKGSVSIKHKSNSAVLFEKVTFKPAQRNRQKVLQPSSQSIVEKKNQVRQDGNHREKDVSENKSRNKSSEIQKDSLCGNRKAPKKQGNGHGNKPRAPKYFDGSVQRRHSLEYTRRSRSPVQHSKHSQYSRYRHGGSCSPVSKKRGNSNIGKRSRSPEKCLQKNRGIGFRASRGSEGRGRHSRSPKLADPRKSSHKHKKSNSKDVDDDIELLRLKKEVILSIVKKPDSEISTNALISTSEPLEKVKEKSSDRSLKKEDLSMDDVNLTANISSETSKSVQKECDLCSSVKSDEDLANHTKSQKEVQSVALMERNRNSTENSRSNSPAIQTMHTRISTKPPEVVEFSEPTSLLNSSASICDVTVKSSDVADSSNSAVSVMVFPGKESTWKIQPFQIMSSEYDSDCELGDQDKDVSSTTTMSEVSSFLVEARKVASQACNIQVSQVSLTPPASLPPERKKEYIDLKKRIAIHEKNIKKKRLLTHFPRSSSPNLQVARDTQPSASKPSSPSANNVPSAKDLHESKLRLKALNIQLQECNNKRDNHKILEDKEHQTITELTIKLTSCVSEIENYEQKIESIQNQLLNLQESLKNTEEALKKSEGNMACITADIRGAKSKKAEYGKVVTDCKTKINELENEIKQVHHVSSIMEKQCSPSSIVGSPNGSKQLFKVEPISDCEDSMELEHQASVGKLCSSVKQDIAGKVEKSLSKHGSQSQTEVISGKMNGAADAGNMSVSEEVVVRSNNLVSSLANSQKLNDLLNEVMHSALQLPEARKDVPLLEPTMKDSTLLSSEHNVQPLVASVLSSLTQQSYDDATTRHQGQALMNSNPQRNVATFHDCTENPFTVSTDDPPTLVLPMIVDGNLDLSIAKPSLSEVAIEALNDGIVKHTGGASLLNESAVVQLKEETVVGQTVTVAEDASSSFVDKRGEDSQPVALCQEQNLVEVNPQVCSVNGNVGQTVSMEAIPPEPMEVIQTEQSSLAYPMTSDELEKGKSLLVENQDISNLPVSTTQHLAESGQITDKSIDDQEKQFQRISREQSTEISNSKTTVDQNEKVLLSKSQNKTNQSSIVVKQTEVKKSKNQLQSRPKTAVSKKAVVDSTTGKEDVPTKSQKCEGRSVAFQVTDMDSRNSSQLQAILQKHLSEIDAVKKQLASSKAKSNSARTSGLRTVQSSPLQNGSSDTDEKLKDTEFLSKLVSEIMKPIPDNLGNFKMAVSRTAPLQFSFHNLIFSDGIIKILPTQPEFVLPPDISLPTPTISSKQTARCSFKPYVSPLLMFASYRSSPNFSTSAKVSVDSLTYSNKIDPNRVFCRFELTGTCSDNSCTSQHLRDIHMTKEDITRELVSYCPSLAEGAEEESVATEASGKLMSFSEKFLKKYTGKVSNGNLWKILVYELNKERMKSNPKKELISFDCDFSLLRSKLQPTENIGMNLRPHLSILPKEDARKRYFNFGPIKPVEPVVSDIVANQHLAAAQKLLDENKTQDALEALEKGLDSNSEEVWLKYAILKSETAREEDLESLYDTFASAVSSTRSYTVMFEMIRLCGCLNSKVKLINCSLAVCRTFDSPDETSRCCFELLINLVLLHLLVGKLPTAIKCFDLARRPIEHETSTEYAGLINVLQRRERIMLCLCHMSVVYSGNLPSSLFSGDSCHNVPTKLTSTEYFAIPFDSSVELPPNGYKRLLKLSKFYLDLLHDSSLPSPEAVKGTLPIFRNVIVFEMVHGNFQKAVNILEKLSSFCPYFSDLWMMLARIEEVKGADGCAVLERAVSSIPVTPELYYLAAKFELSRTDASQDSNKCRAKSCEAKCQGRSYHILRAVEWLRNCVTVFYSTTDVDNLTPAEVLTLYRKLLNQMIGYKQTVPSFAEGIEPQNLKEHLCPLWLCYCLMVELTVVPSTSSSGAELFHLSAEEAYESAVHAVTSLEGHKAIWKEYILFMRAKAVTGSRKDFLRLVDCVLRCIMDVKSSADEESASRSQQFSDYSFHNEILSVVTTSLPSSSSFKLDVLQKLARKFPQNESLILQYVQCALEQVPPSTNVAQTVLAEVLALYPECPSLWKQAIEVEVLLGNIKEARWMFNKALEQLPLHVCLWRDFAVFELKQLISVKKSLLSVPDASLQAVISVFTKAKKVGIDLSPILQELASL